VSAESRTLQFIRQIVSEPSQYSLPIAPQIANSSILGSYGVGGFSYLTNSFNQSIVQYLAVDQDLITRFIDYEDQDDSPLIASSLDIYADDSTQTKDAENKTLWVESDDEYIRDELDSMLHKNLLTEETIWPLARTLCKYGNYYGELIVKKNEGVIGMNVLPPPVMRRLEFGSGREGIIGFIYDPTGQFRMTTFEFIDSLKSRIQDGGKMVSDYYGKPPESIVMEDWEIAHFRLRGKKPQSLYGFGIGEPARWIFKRLVLLEDSIIMHRLTRAPSRYAFYVDVSNIPPNETSAYLNKVRQAVKKQKYVNPNTNKMDEKFNMLTTMDDFFLPVRDGRESTKVESLAGPVYDAIEDIKYFENKLFAALKVPKPFLTYEESTAKTNLSAEDSRFARTIMRIQREMKNGYRKICNVHLAAKGINPDKVEFELKMTTPSAIFELAQLEIRAAEVELADKFGAYAPRSWILREIMHFTDEQIEEMDEMKRKEEMKGEAAEDEESGGGGGGSSGAIDKLVSRRDEPSSSSTSGSAPLAVAAGESKGYPSRKLGSDEFWNGGVKKNLSTILERLEEAKATDKKFSRHWDRTTGLLNELRDNLRRKK